MSAVQYYHSLPISEVVSPPNVVTGKRRPNMTVHSFSGQSQDESLGLDVAPHNGKGSPPIESRGNDPSRRWRPLYLRFGFLLVFAIGFVILLILLAILNRYSASHQGLARSGGLR